MIKLNSRRKDRKLSYFIAVIIIICLGFLIKIYFLPSGNRKLKKDQYLTIQNFNKDQFALGFVRSQSLKFSNIESIFGGIIPHDMTANHMIINFFGYFQNNQPGKIILLGPNHLEKGPQKILTTLKDWKTPFGVVVAHKSSIQKLVNSGPVYIDDFVLAQDHSITNIIPYINYILPQSQIIPILISSLVSQEEIMKFINDLDYIIDNRTIVVASVDFSHYLSKTEADLKDQETLEVIKNRNYNKLLRLDNSHTDSVLSLMVLIRLMEINQVDNIHVLGHLNSDEIYKKGATETTGYYSIIYHKKNN